MKYKSVLIITYGRSGSTLLQGLLNSIEGCLVRGENNDLCRGLFLAYQSLRNAKLQHCKGSDTPTSPWFGAGALSEEAFFQDARRLIRNQLLGDMDDKKFSCIGFKEIRYMRALQAPCDQGSLFEYFDFLARLFDKPAFIFLTRDHEAVANSAWWQSCDPAMVKARLREFELCTTTYGEDKDWVFTIDYNDMVNRTPRLKGLFEFMGAPYIEEQIDTILATRHSYIARRAVARKRPG